MVAQVVQASLGLIPKHAVAVGVRTTGRQVQIVFQMSRVRPADIEDISEIKSELEVLVGPDVDVTVSIDRSVRPDLSGKERVRWIFRIR